MHKTIRQPLYIERDQLTESLQNKAKIVNKQIRIIFAMSVLCARASSYLNMEKKFHMNILKINELYSKSRLT